jgi:hypothetical protein
VKSNVGGAISIVVGVLFSNGWDKNT